MSTVLCCGNCDRPVADGAAMCTTCSTELARRLRTVPSILEDLFVTFAKQDRLGDDGGTRGKPSEAPLPVRFDVRRVIDALSNTMTTWARVLVDHRGWDVPNPPRRSPHNGQRGVVVPVSSPSVDLACYAAQWLADHVGHLRMHPAALEAYHELDNSIDAANLAIDRTPALAFRGPCQECKRELHAAPQAAEVVCAHCGHSHHGPTLRARLLDDAADRLVTAVELSAALTGLSEQPVPLGTIRSWRSRGQLAPHAWLHDDRVVVAHPAGPRDKALFRVGDAVALLEKLRAT